MVKSFNYVLLFGGLILIMLFVGCATVPVPILSPMQIRQITTRSIDGSYKDVFKATLTVLQDQGYIIKNTDMNSGLITASVDRATSAGSRFWQIMALGYAYDEGSAVEVSCVLDEANEKTIELRINIQEVKYGQTSRLSGTTEQETKTIYDEKIYQSLFNEIQTEVKRREAIGR
jgi:hypothetical protein